MLAIRLFRIGKKNQPSFKIVVTDKRRPPAGGRFIEEVGFYNPLTKEKVLRRERIEYWLSIGAKPSDTVYNLLLTEKIIEGKKIPLHKKKRKQREEDRVLEEETNKEKEVSKEKVSESEEPLKQEPDKQKD